MANAKSNCFGARLCLPKIDSDYVNHQSFLKTFGKLTSVS
jgi:hypothetical protein